MPQGMTARDKLPVKKRSFVGRAVRRSVPLQSARRFELSESNRLVWDAATGAWNQNEGQS